MYEDTTCRCPDPMREGKFLWKCGTDICESIRRRLNFNGYYYMEPATIIACEVEDNEER